MLKVTRKNIQRLERKICCLKSKTCEDATLTLNTSPFLTVASGSTTDISLVDQNDVDITPISVVGSKIVLPDETYNVYVNGVLNTTFTAQAMEDLTINITA